MMLFGSLLFVVLFDLILTDQDALTCGSTFKLINQQSADRLHSHEVRYGSGSGQQSVTGTSSPDDVNSYWQIQADCERGTPIECGTVVRLLHLTTRKNLHSHDFVSPLSHNQEVSAYGEDGVGDDGDNWRVICTTSKTLWMRNDPIRFQHVLTGKYLHLNGETYGRPIHGQKEISAVSYMSNQNLWQVDAGVYIRRTSEPLSSLNSDPLNSRAFLHQADRFDDEL